MQHAQGSVPRHVAIIMDGNNRWAKKRFLPGVAGHKAGVDAVRAVVEVCAEAGVEVLTLFAFSSENWQRPAAEVGALMELFLRALRREAKKLDQNGILSCKQRCKPLRIVPRTTLSFCYKSPPTMAVSGISYRRLNSLHAQCRPVSYSPTISPLNTYKIV